MSHPNLEVIMRWLVVVIVVAVCSTGFAQDAEIAEDVQRRSEYTQINSGNTHFSNSLTPLTGNYSSKQVNDDDFKGPRRDWGDDWIFYDDGGAIYHYHLGFLYWMRTRFTPEASFRLEGIRLRTRYNNGGQEYPLKLRVYSEDQENGNLLEVQYEFITNEIQDRWWNHELDEDDFIQFRRGENFSIAVGPYPGAGPGEDPQNFLWAPCLDRGTITRRSLIATAFLAGENRGEPNNEEWEIIDRHDLLIRANGTNIPDAVDVEVVAAYNRGGFENQGQWILLTDSSYTYFADIVIHNNDLEEGDHTLNFFITDSNGEELFDYDMPGQAIDAGDTISIECDSAWTVPEDAELGRYEVWVTAVLEDDEDEDNSSAGLEQFVYDLTDEDEVAQHVWLGYISDDDDNLIPHGELCECEENVGAMFYHPDENVNPLQLTEFHIAVHSDNEVRDVAVRIGVMNRNVNQFGWIRELESETNREEGWEWLVFEVPNEFPAYIRSGEAFIILLEHNEHVSVMVDNTPPVAGTVSPYHMPYVICYADDDLRNAEEGDFAIRARLNEFIIPRRPIFRVEPNPMEFGYDLDRGTDHTMDLTLTNLTGETVTIRNVLVGRGDDEYLSVELRNGNIRERFDIPHDSSAVIEVTYHAPQFDHVLESPLRFVTNADVDPQFNVWVNAGTVHPDHVVLDGFNPPNQLTLLPPHPNPFNSQTHIRYYIPTETHLDIGLYDISGRQVMTLLSGVRQTGVWSVTVDGSGLVSGVYFIRLNSTGYQLSQKVLLVR